MIERTPKFTIGLHDSGPVEWPVSVNRVVIDTVIGPLGLEADGDALVGVHFHAPRTANREPRTANREPRTAHREPRTASVLAEARRELEAYFAGRLKVFSVPLAPRGTPFQQGVWSELVKIPYGETRSYRELAESIGQPAAVRAVGAANGRNPIPILIPCHRVIGSNGKLVGFGGGLDTKRRLLSLEQGGRLF